jgi:hypothetical protein
VSGEVSVAEFADSAEAALGESLVGGLAAEPSLLTGPTCPGWISLGSFSMMVGAAAAPPIPAPTATAAPTAIHLREIRR